MKSLRHLEIEPYKRTEINKALTAYYEEYRMVSALKGDSLFESDACVRFHHYPFTQVSMPYASINLINLAIEQSLIVMYDRLVFEKVAVGPWEGIDDYRSLVSDGCWLVPKLNTKVLSPVPLNKDLFFTTSINKTRSGKRRIVLSFSVNCQDYITSSGIAVFDAKKIYLRSMG